MSNVTTFFLFANLVWKMSKVLSSKNKFDEWAWYDEKERKEGEL